MGRITILLIEPSFLIREGIKTLISQSGKPFNMEESETTIVNLSKLLQKTKPHVVMANPVLLTDISFPRETNDDLSQIQYVALIHGQIEPKVQGRFNFMLPLNADKPTLIKKIEEIYEACSIKNQEKESATLSERESTILKYVALGLTNNDIAERLFISSHTVMTHRKNITRKLGIKTISGLTVYAILNKLIKVEELQGTQ
ncbi:MAG: response regulator transcription factor [Bacteroidales bacterium]|nr:response regulator transcription factor [Bacteroidales bacterium]